MRKLMSLTVAVLTTSSVFAGGYRISMQGQKQLGMGHTGVAVVSSAESTFFNPAGLSFLEGKFNASVGGNYLVSHTKFQSVENNLAYESKNKGTPFSAYASYRVNEWFTAALGVYSPYGSTVKWDQNWAGSHLVNKISLQAIFIQPTIAIKLSDYFSIGGGPIMAVGGVNFNKNLFRGDGVLDENGNHPNVDIKGDGIVQWGYNVGFMLNPTDKLRLGFNYRSEIVMKAKDGKAEFTNIPAFMGGLGYKNGTTKFDASLPLPAEITVGLSYQVTEKLLLAFDYNRTQWAAYDNLTVDFTEMPGAPVNPSNPNVNPRNYKNVNTYRLGAQYVVNPEWTVRAGWYYDESPVQAGYFAPETPRNDSYAFTGGLSYNINSKLSIDASFLYLRFSQINASYDYHPEPVSGGQRSTFGGTYKNSAFSPGIGLSYKI
ncbi:outer membrane protein transport protein [Flavobacterium agricola]|uniref:Outer membrane protein transport protein n=1 Tax=Flavobacterium agricola TaxID=2870839 RepID=A0ABY6LWN1_9FLAO|nr:outer membrane protein transport protein [Flavobacterium agricola]UYW00739.1 outer membrane protein transport protein [Flavobacterium agricola]